MRYQQPDEQAVVARFRARRRKSEMPKHMQALLGVILGACLLTNWITLLRIGW
jgi:hypothetical protein